MQIKGVISMVSDIDALRAYLTISNYCNQQPTDNPWAMCENCVFNKLGIDEVLCTGDDLPVNWEHGEQHERKSR